jgi:hypothetical protein
MAPSVALIELQYLPPVAFFVVLAKHQRVWIEQQEHYQKSSYRNRCHIAGANGLLRLSVPLKKGKNEQQPITETRIAYDKNWMHQHWASITSAYGNAPFFDFYAPAIAPLFEQKWPLLFDFNYRLLEAIIDVLALDVALVCTRAYHKQAPPEVDDYRNLIHPKKAIPFNLSPYPQVFMEKHGFMPNLSILDLIFCAGPQSSLILEQS